jgi:hypothetical protein
LTLRYPVTVNIGEPITGEVDAEHLYQRVLELGTEIQTAQSVIE